MACEGRHGQADLGIQDPWQDDVAVIHLLQLLLDRRGQRSDGILVGVGVEDGVSPPDDADHVAALVPNPARERARERPQGITRG